MNQRRIMHTIYYFILSPLLLLSACTAPIPVPSSPATQVPTLEIQPPHSAKDLILATTTSTRDTGLLDVLTPLFEQETGYIIKVIAVGSGEALKMGESGNADVLLVHSPAAEIEYMQNGFGRDRFLVMSNDFIIAGPKEDPAGIRDSDSVLEAFQKIFDADAVFISRGDDSGTHKAELNLWKLAAKTPSGSWYQETGQGMAATLKIASEKHAYVLTDRGTYLATQTGEDLEILVEGDPALLNVYHVITINPLTWPQVNYDGAIAFAKFLTMPKIQEIIGGFGVEQYGQPLFLTAEETSE